MRFQDVDWALANCGGTDFRAWFPTKDDNRKDYTMVERICERCEIKKACHKYAIDNEEMGYWGGEYFSERK